MSNKNNYNNRYILVKAVKSESNRSNRSSSSNQSNDSNNIADHDGVWYLVKEKQINLYKEWGIKFID